MSSLVDLLGKTELFAGLARSELAACAEQFREVKFVKGQSLFVRGEKAASLYLVAQGRVRLAITTEDGKTVSTFSPVVLRQVISAETAAQIGDALRGVVSDRGTAAAAAVPGFTISGKTGTAQKINPVTHRYDKVNYIASFSGFAPINDPAIVVVAAQMRVAGGRLDLEYAVAYLEHRHVERHVSSLLPLSR